MNLSTSSQPFLVAALYRFLPLDGLPALRDELRALCGENGIRGTLILAGEGINGTVAGTDAAIDVLLRRLCRLPGWEGAEVKLSRSPEMPFVRMKVRVKREIVTMGLPGIDPLRDAGVHVGPRDWNALIARPDTIVIDTRNAYETAIGGFEGAVDPRTETFRDFPAWVEANRRALEGKQLAMYCTGGIRCEKATAYMRQAGFDRVFHLKGGILNYLGEVPERESLWRGECFVFDERVALGHGLSVGEAELCRACGHPLTGEDTRHPAYREGVSCPHCVTRYGDADRRRFAERQRQFERARGRSPS